ncbi:MAG: serine/threonine protein kinase [Sandaracinaceae bacterium]|nr:serine/threonine protein kinase [Sandaracinaceae bacterium]
MRRASRLRFATATWSTSSTSGTDEDGRPFMVMELLVGRPLSARLEVAPAVGVEEAVGIMARVLSGLAAVHDAKIIHRDLKPENVFLVEDEEGVSPKLLDFGVSRALDSRGGLQSVLPTVENAIVGTPHYMSPEQARGLRTVDHRSDLWSAGVMLFELLTGTLPSTIPPRATSSSGSRPPRRPRSPPCAPSSRAARAARPEGALARALRSLPHRARDARRAARGGRAGGGLRPGGARDGGVRARGERAADGRGTSAATRGRRASAVRRDRCARGSPR